jgi:uncharacterized tellurite resistance protein B-like protein
MFAEILERSENPVAAAMLLMLSWIASSDGEIGDDEMEELRAIANSGNGYAELLSVIEVAERSQIEDLQLSCEVLQKLEPKHRRLMLQMAVSMSLQDGYLTAVEGHIVRLVADVLSQKPSDLDGLFREMTGQAFPAPADPSSVEWWEARQRRSEPRTKAQNSEQRAGAEAGPAKPDIQRLRDLGVLGLDETATIDQVKEAYKRMAQIHHPDKFAPLGPQAVKAAEVTFLRIRSAYERLVVA